MVASARVAYLSGRAGEFGVNAQVSSVDMKRVRQRKDDIVVQSRGNGEKALLTTKNLDLIYGEARFTRPKSIFVTKNNGQTCSLTANRIECKDDSQCQLRMLRSSGFSIGVG